jgi:hypothetical protein
MKFLIKLILIVLFSLYSILIINYYAAGDRLVYREGYDAISESTLLDGIQFYFLYFSSPDFIWFVFAFLFSLFSLDFNIFSYFISLMVFMGLFFIADKHIKMNALYFIFIINLFINIQFLTLYFSSVRLGFAVCFLCFAFIVNTNIKKNTLSIISILSHFSVILLFTITIFRSLLIEGFSTRKKLIPILTGVVFLVAIAYFSDLIVVKILHYLSISSSNGLSKNFLKFSLIPFIVYFINRDKFTLLMNFTICFILLIFDEERFYQLGYLYASWSIFTSHFIRAVPIAIAFTTIPTIRGIEFIIGVFARGNGLDPDNFGWFNL